MEKICFMYFAKGLSTSLKKIFAFEDPWYIHLYNLVIPFHAQPEFT